MPAGQSRFTSCGQKPPWPIDYGNRAWQRCPGRDFSLKRLSPPLQRHVVDSDFTPPVLQSGRDDWIRTIPSIAIGWSRLKTTRFFW